MVCRGKKLDVTRAKSWATKKERLSTRIASPGDQKDRRLLAVSSSNPRHASRKTG